jgi:hypothetical protein
MARSGNDIYFSAFCLEVAMEYFQPFLQEPARVFFPKPAESNFTMIFSIAFLKEYLLK